MNFAGLWEVHGEGEDLLLSCTIITTAATDFMAPIHSRMPAILEGDDVDAWLTVSTGDDLLRPSEGELAAHPVDRPVGSSRNNRPDLLKPIEPS